MAEEYCLYIDDSGSRLPDYEEPNRNDGVDCFALGGVLFKKSDKNKIKDAHTNFCEQWELNYPLHSSEIRGPRDNFIWLGDSEVNQAFMESLNDLLISIPVTGFAAVIHRPGYNAKYKEKYGDQRWRLCKTAFCILVERVCKHLKEKGGKLEIFFEEVGKREDNDLINYCKELKRKGSPFNPENSSKYGELNNEDYKKIILGEPQRKKKFNRTTQLADLFLYPMLKGGYDPNYRPYKTLMKEGKIIDALLLESEIEKLGVKYSCFE